jgi:hypothetical protein
VDVEHVGRDAENAGALLDLGVPALCQWAPGLAEMTDVAVGHRDELDLMALRGPECRHAGCLELGVIRVRAEGDDAQRPVWRRLGVRDDRYERESQNGDKGSESSHVSPRWKSHGAAGRSILAQVGYHGAASRPTRLRSRRAHEAMHG